MIFLAIALSGFLHYGIKYYINKRDYSIITDTQPLVDSNILIIQRRIESTLIDILHIVFAISFIGILLYNTDYSEGYGRFIAVLLSLYIAWRIKDTFKMLANQSKVQIDLNNKTIGKGKKSFEIDSFTITRHISSDRMEFINLNVYNPKRQDSITITSAYENEIISLENTLKENLKL
ncbi:MAG: hypothetical protein K2X86_12535 [Cytophagaceae bacterium]|nr:hypothetical protein [Cytophagaceae bacterium]